VAIKICNNIAINKKNFTSAATAIKLRVHIHIPLFYTKQDILCINIPSVLPTLMLLGGGARGKTEAKMASFKTVNILLTWERAQIKIQSLAKYCRTSFLVSTTGELHNNISQ
jgi:hypothetical protein